MNCEINFRIANPTEHDKVLRFLREHFFTEEPINRAYPSVDDSMEEKFLLSLLPDGNIILAIDAANNDEIAGMACIGEITKNYSNESWIESEATTNIKWRDILKFMSHIEAKSRVCERYDVSKAVHLHGVTVNKKYRGMSLGKKLFEECFSVAKMRNYKLVSADCTSVYSTHIAESLGMEFVSLVTYDEYHDKIGYKLFNPIQPHTEIKTFVKKI
jgi:ribosomal protein S18 acetylase RimI-like enzyme